MGAVLTTALAGLFAASPQTYEFGSPDFAPGSRLQSLSCINSDRFLGITATAFLWQGTPQQRSGGHSLLALRQTPRLNPESDAFGREIRGPLSFPRILRL
jgi:hypothetical protein